MPRSRADGRAEDSAPKEWPFGDGELLRGAEQHDDVAGFERMIGLGNWRARAATAHSGDLDAALEIEFGERAADGRRAIGEHHRMQPRLQVVGSVRSVGRAVIEAAKQAVTLLADRADPLEDTSERHAEKQQR